MKNSVDEKKIRFPKGEWEIIKQHAKTTGESANGFIIRAVKETMQNDKKKKG